MDQNVRTRPSLGGTGMLNMFLLPPPRAGVAKYLTAVQPTKNRVQRLNAGVIPPASPEQHHVVG